LPRSHENIRIMLTNEIRRMVLENLKRKQRATDTEILAKTLEKSDSLPLFLPQEIAVEGEKPSYVDMAFSGKIVFEIKSNEAEFKEAVEKAKEKYLPSPKFATTEFYVLTNWEKWRVYHVSRNGEISLNLDFEGERDAGLKVLGQIVSSLSEIKIFPTPRNVERLFTLESDRIIRDLNVVFKEAEKQENVRPLYEAYKRIIAMLYSEADEDFMKSLFIKHTLMHSITLACLSSALGKIGDPVDMCSGALLDVDIALPYLNWWKIARRSLHENLKRILDSIMSEVVSRAKLIDWETWGCEDVFRQLYEVLVEPEVRRRIGEYYTPIWLVEFMLKEFTLADLLVLDRSAGQAHFWFSPSTRKSMKAKTQERR